MRFLLGNMAPLEVHRVEPDGSQHPHARGVRHEDWKGRGPHLVFDHSPLDAPHTEFTPGDADSLADILRNAHHAWDYHSAAPASWVMLVDPGVDPARAELVRVALADSFGVKEPGPEVVTALVTNAGLDFVSKQLSGVASATTIAKYVAVTANTTTPAATDTTLTGEITTASGGLLRAAGTYAHTTGASTYTMTITLTANGSDVLPVTLGKAGIFDAASVGNLVYEDLISPTVTLSASGDAITLTETVTV